MIMQTAETRLFLFYFGPENETMLLYTACCTDWTPFSKFAYMQTQLGSINENCILSEDGFFKPCIAMYWNSLRVLISKQIFH